MTLQQWVDNGWLKPHRTNSEEIRRILSITDRELKDVEADISPDGRFRAAYNAILSLCTVLLYAEGYRVAKESLKHYRTLAALPLILGSDRKKDAEYLDACRIKRNKVEYDYAGAAGNEEANECVQFARELRDEVLVWLKLNHPEYVK